MDKIASCYEMVESLIAYGYASLDNPRDVLGSHYMEDYIKELGTDTVVKIASQVADSIAHIEYDVYTDSEDCSYNSVKYKNGSSWSIDPKHKDVEWINFTA